MTSERLWTVGHSTLSADDFTAELDTAEIGVLADVRSLPGSRHNPQFDREEMERWLPESDIAYVHLPDLGGRRRNQDVDPNLNAGWENASFRNYADYTFSERFETGLRQLIDLTESDRVAIMCAEAVPWRCHRSLIANTLVTRGWTVDHLMPNADPIRHELGRWGAKPVILDGGRVSYPAGARPRPTSNVDRVGPPERHPTGGG